MTSSMGSCVASASRYHGRERKSRVTHDSTRIIEMKMGLTVSCPDGRVLGFVCLQTADNTVSFVPPSHLFFDLVGETSDRPGNDNNCGSGLSLPNGRVCAVRSQHTLPRSCVPLNFCDLQGLHQTPPHSASKPCADVADRHGRRLCGPNTCHEYEG